jgi:hypothetical protein
LLIKVFQIGVAMYYDRRPNLASQFLVNRMKTHHRFIFSVIGLSLSVILIGVGIFGTEDIRDVLASVLAIDISKDVFKYMAFTGLGLMMVSNWQLVPLVMDWRDTSVDLTAWATRSPKQAQAMSLLCVVVAATVFGAMFWVTFLAEGTAGKRASTRGFSLSLLVGGALLWLGWTIFKASISKPND